MILRSARPWLFVALGLGAFAACAPTVVSPPDADAGADVVDVAPPPDAVAAVDAARVDVPALDAPFVDDPPTRLPMCTSRFGTALSRAYGRLDGRLVAIVPTNARGCNADPDHLHLQIAANGAVYDVAVNLGARPVAGVPDLAVASDDVALPGGPWAEGWHPSVTPLDYVATLGQHAGNFTPLAPADVAARLQTELRDVNRIAVFATGYGPDGAHNVHRNNGFDGAIALSPSNARAHLLLFRFATQVF